MSVMFDDRGLPLVGLSLGVLGNLLVGSSWASRADVLRQSWFPMVVRWLRDSGQELAIRIVLQREADADLEQGPWFRREMRPEGFALVDVWVKPPVPACGWTGPESGLVYVGHVESLLGQVADWLGVSPPPPAPLTKRERVWLDEDPGRERPVSELVLPAFREVGSEVLDLPADFDMWELFPGGVGDPVGWFVERFEAFEEPARDGVAYVLRSMLRMWAGRDGCYTDSGAMQAVGLLCGGRKLWEAALADPDAYEGYFPEDDIDLEEILMLVE